MKKIKNKKLIVFILILFISIGFAYLSAALNIAGLIGYKGNTWDVHFESVQVIHNIDGTERPVIDSNNTSVSFNVSLSEPSEYYEFYIDVVNSGTLDAMIGEIIKTGITSTNSEYLDYNVTYSNGESIKQKDLLAKNTKVRLSVKVEYKYSTSILATPGENNFSLTLKYIQATDDANEVEIITESNENSTFVLNNVKANSLSNLKIYGNTEQTQYKGQNLYNYKDYKFGDGTVDDDGWITMSYENNTGSRQWIYYYTHNLDLDDTKTYTVIVEIKNVSGVGKLFPTSHYEVSGQLKDKFYETSSLKNNSILIYTSDVMEDTSDNGIRSYLLVEDGDTASVTFRLSVIEGTNITTDNFVYEPYVGGEPSPSPNYPQKVRSVNSVNIINNGKNLINYFDMYNKVNGTTKFEVADDGTISSNGVDGRIWIYSNSNWFVTLPAGNYTFSIFFSDVPTSPSSHARILRSSDTEATTCFKVINVLNNKEVSTTFTLSQTTTLGFMLKFGSEVTCKIQLEKGDSSTSFELYHNDSYNINLNDYELNSIDNYRDYIYNKDGEWYIHREINKHIFNNEHVFSVDGNQRWSINFATSNIPAVFVENYDSGSNFTNAYSDILKISTQSNCSIANTNLFGYSAYTYSYVYFSRNMGSDESEVKSNLYGHYMVYPLKDQYNEKITDTTLINQLNAIINNNLYEGTNIITISGNDLAPTVTFDYITQ